MHFETSPIPSGAAAGLQTGKLRPKRQTCDVTAKFANLQAGAMIGAMKSALPKCAKLESVNRRPLTSDPRRILTPCRMAARARPPWRSMSPEPGRRKANTSWSSTRTRKTQLRVRWPNLDPAPRDNAGCRCRYDRSSARLMTPAIGERHRPGLAYRPMLYMR
jgi:hypothetical protein